MVGRPWAQIQGTSSSGRLPRSLYISFLSSAVPIMIAVRQAREASIAITFEGRRILLAPDVPDPRLPDGLSPEEGILDVHSKIDLQPQSGPEPGVSAVTGEGIRELAGELRRRIVREDDLASKGRWCFCDELRSRAES